MQGGERVAERAKPVDREGEAVAQQAHAGPAQRRLATPNASTAGTDHLLDRIDG